MDLPIACSLSPDQLRERRETILATFRNSVVRRTEICDGYRYEFASQATTLAELQRMVDLERECCRFLDFRLSADGTTIFLDVSGPQNAVGVIDELFG